MRWPCSQVPRRWTSRTRGRCRAGTGLLRSGRRRCGSRSERVVSSANNRGSGAPAAGWGQSASTTTRCSPGSSAIRSPPAALDELDALKGVLNHVPCPIITAPTTEVQGKRHPLRKSGTMLAMESGRARRDHESHSLVAASQENSSQSRELLLCPAPHSRRIDKNRHHGWTTRGRSCREFDSFPRSPLDLGVPRSRWPPAWRSARAPCSSWRTAMTATASLITIGGRAERSSPRWPRVVPRP